MMTKRRSVHASLMINYALFSVILGIIGFLVYDGMYDARDAYVNRTLPMVEADRLVREDWESIPYETVESFGGYIQVLDQRLNVVFARGKGAGEAQTSYSEEELYALFYEGNRSDYRSLAPFQSSGEEYRLLVTIPDGAVKKESRLVKTTADITDAFTGILLRGLLWFAAAFLFSLWLYGRLTARKFTNPLADVSRGLERIAEGGGGERLRYNASKELMQLRHHFNRMADRLEQAESDKRKLEQERMRLMMDISHDLKTPISTIQGYAEVLQLGMEEDPEQRRKYAGRIHAKSKLIASLVNDLFELTKLESADMPFEPQPGDFAELCRTTAADLYDSFERKGIGFDIRIADKPVKLSYQDDLMRRALTNTLANALKYNPPGASVWLELEAMPDGALLTVGDNGPGISENVRHSVFEPFVRGDRARKSDGGSGLGLSIAKSVVERHGGRIWLDPDAEGTVIRIRLFRESMNGLDEPRAKMIHRGVSK